MWSCTKRRTSWFWALTGCNAPPTPSLCPLAHSSALKLLSPTCCCATIHWQALDIQETGKARRAAGDGVFITPPAPELVWFHILSTASHCVSYARWCVAALPYHGSSSPWWFQRVATEYQWGFFLMPEAIGPWSSHRWVTSHVNSSICAHGQYRILLTLSTSAGRNV